MPRSGPWKPGTGTFRFKSPDSSERLDHSPVPEGNGRSCKTAVPTRPRPTYNTQSVSHLANRPTMTVISQHNPVVQVSGRKDLFPKKEPASRQPQQSARSHMGRVPWVKEEFVDSTVPFKGRNGRNSNGTAR